MLGMLLAMLYWEAIWMVPVVASPRLIAIAHVRTNPVMREISVAVDMDAVERARDGDAAGSGSSARSGSTSEMVASC